MDLIFSYATSVELRSKTGTTPAANSEIDSKFLEQSIANTLSGAKTFKISTPLNVGSSFKKSFNITDLANIKHVRSIFIKSSQLLQVQIKTTFTSAPELTQSFQTKFCFMDFTEPAVGFQTAIFQTVIEVSNLSSTTSADSTVVIVGY